MHARSLKIGAGVLAAVAAGAIAFPTSAFADYAPAPHDVVGTGSDTLQALGDFVADGSYVADGGYNGAGNKYKFISVDATADANTRLAYGPGGANAFGANGTTGSSAASNYALSNTTAYGCGPGTSSFIGSGNQATATTDSTKFPCVLAPSVVLRAGLSPEQRPNGSGAGYNVLKADTNASTDAPIGDGGWGLVNFSRASAAKNGGSTPNANFDSITVGTDLLAMLSADGSTGHATNDTVALTTAQLTAIYSCTNGPTSGHVNGYEWADVVAGGSSDPIVPLLPQVGSGTRTTFLNDIGNPTLGTCVRNVEENDPYAIFDSGSEADAIEPMAQTRLNLFQGIGGATGAGSISTTGYFQDPTCPFNPTTSSQSNVNTTSIAPAQCQGSAAALVPHVKEWTTGGYTDNRNLYIYFRHLDTFSATTWQPGSTLNWVRTMFYNPCTAGITSTTIIPPSNSAAFSAAGCQVDAAGNPVGKGGDPYFASAAGQQDISDAGINPTWVLNSPAP
jgi:hypothetical protein